MMKQFQVEPIYIVPNNNKTIILVTRLYKNGVWKDFTNGGKIIMEIREILSKI